MRLVTKGAKAPTIARSQPPRGDLASDFRPTCAGSARYAKQRSPGALPQCKVRAFLAPMQVERLVRSRRQESPSPSASLRGGSGEEEPAAAGAERCRVRLRGRHLRLVVAAGAPRGAAARATPRGP